MVRTISHSFAALTREILFLPLEHKIHIFSPPCNILYLRYRNQVTQYINNSCHLAWKYAWIFVHRHYLFREANSFPRAKLEENCELRGTDNVQGQISVHIFAPNGGYCLYYPILQIFFVTRAVLKIGEYSRIFPSFSWGIFGHVASLDPSRASKKIWWIINIDYWPSVRSRWLDIGQVLFFAWLRQLIFKQI